MSAASEAPPVLEVEDLSAGYGRSQVLFCQIGRAHV